MLLGFDKNKHPVFIKSIYGCFTIFFLAFLLFQRANKEKADFNKITGTLIYFDKTYQNWPKWHFGKYSYIQVNSSDQVFEIFVGKGKSDFGPEYEKIDNLAIGDTISIYYDVDLLNGPSPINRLVFFIDKGNENVFVQSNKFNLIAAYGLFGFSLLFITLLVYLKRIGKIL